MQGNETGLSVQCGSSGCCSMSVSVNEADESLRDLTSLDQVLTF